jgi:hypothetical protein
MDTAAGRLTAGCPMGIKSAVLLATLCIAASRWISAGIGSGIKLADQELFDCFDKLSHVWTLTINLRLIDRYFAPGKNFCSCRELRNRNTKAT